MFGKTAARCALGAAIVCLAPAAALAHPGFAPHSGLEAGFLHPLTGVDHLLAMITVGIFAAHVGRRGLWSLPLGFLMLMAVGGVLGTTGVRLPFVEMMIALSVVALGLAVAIPRQWPVAAATLLVGAFAVFHGHAHGAELPTGVPAAPYAVGFMLATMLLLLAGIALGAGLLRLDSTRTRGMSQWVGLGIAVAGIGLVGAAV
jgi:urease accessory protein